MQWNALTKQLGILPGNQLLIFDAPEGYVSTLSPLPDGASPSISVDGYSDVVLVLVRDRAELGRLLPDATGDVAPSGIFWIAWPKKSSKRATDLDRDWLWAALDASGWTGAASITVDDPWSALRFKRLQ